VPQPRCFKIHADDNVATLLDDVPAAVPDVRVLGHSAQAAIAVGEPIKLGHKIALSPIASGSAVIKFGVAIGRASRDIAAGQWVHLHNCSSLFDQRSQTLDLHSGAATDTKYE
jgi:hypothetical protein